MRAQPLLIGKEAALLSNVPKVISDLPLFREEAVAF